MNVWVIVDAQTGKPLERYTTGIRAYLTESRANMALKLMRYHTGTYKVVRYDPLEGQP